MHVSSACSYAVAACSWILRESTQLHLTLQDLDGIVLTIDPQHPETEKELETFYMNFAQPNALTMKQCLTLAVQVVKEGAYSLGGWQGEILCEYDENYLTLTDLVYW